MIKGFALFFCAAVAHHATLVFGSVLYILPVVWLAIIDRNADAEGRSVEGREESQTVPKVITRTAIFALLSIVGVIIVLLPYWIALLKYPITQMPIPHASRSNLILNPEWGVNYFVVPYGALALALPFIVLIASTEKRLRPLLYGFWLTFLFGLGGTTPVPKLLLGRAYDVLTYERFAFWDTVMAMTLTGQFVMRLVDSFGCHA